jgi:peptidoglycan/LPS O-acetylase OafA/YrhL
MVGISKSHIKSLDGLRGLAILLVLFYHLFKFSIFKNIAYLGWIGVDLFFVLSSFLITSILLETKGNSHYFRNFYARRSLRIFPLYFGVLTVFFLVVAIISEKNTYLDEQVYFWTYTSNFLFAYRGYFGDHMLAHFWSLAIEEQFYLVWPVIVFLLSKRSLIIASFLLLTISFLSRWAYAGEFFASTFTLCRLDAIAVGSIIATLYKLEMKFSKIFIPFLALFVATTIFFSMQNNFYGFNINIQRYGYSLLALFFGSLLITTIEVRAVSKFFSTGILTFFGRYAYGLYVFHFIFLKLAQRLYPEQNPILTSLTVLVLSIIAAVAS